MIAIVNSGAKYAEKIIPSSITDKTYKTKREIEGVKMFMKNYVTARRSIARSLTGKLIKNANTPKAIAIFQTMR